MLLECGAQDLLKLTVSRFQKMLKVQWVGGGEGGGGLALLSKIQIVGPCFNEKRRQNHDSVHSYTSAAVPDANNLFNSSNYKRQIRSSGLVLGIYYSSEGLKRKGLKRRNDCSVD